MNQNEGEKENITKNLLNAFAKRNQKHVSDILEKNFDINKHKFLGSTPLITAISDVDMHKFIPKILEKGADVNAKEDEGGTTALMNAAVIPYNDIIKILLEKGANPNIQDKTGKTALHWAVDTEGFIEEGGDSNETVQLLLNAGANLNILDKDNETPLFKAIRGEYLGEAQQNIIEKLLEAGADPNVKNATGETPLSIALYNMNDKAVVLLLNRGADPSIALKDEDSSVLFKAAAQGKVNIIKLLLKIGADPNVKNKDGSTPLSLAIQSKKFLVVKELLEGGADPNIKNLVNYAPLHYAAVDNQERVVKQLIAKGANINIVNAEKETPLIKAAQYNAYDTVKILLRNKADPNVQTVTGDTALMFAVINENNPITKQLIDNGADLNIQNTLGTTALYYAVEYHNDQIVKTLLEKGANANIASEGLTPLILATATGDFEALSMLLHYGADVNIGEANDETPIMVAIQKKDLNFVREIAEYKPNINHQDKKGKTALIMAVETEDTDIIKFLMSLNPDLSVKDNTGKTAAEYTTDPEILEILGVIIEESKERKWEGFLKADIDLFTTIFEKPSDISVCPVCASYQERIDGCMYMKHKCPSTLRHQRLYNQFKDSEGMIEWCTLCGRITDGHHHHYLLSPAESTDIPGLAKVKPTTGNFRFFDTDCVDSGGGGQVEKIKRFQMLFTTACKLQEEVGLITHRKARITIIESMWNAPLDESLNVTKIMEEKKFDIPCGFPEVSATATPALEEVVANVKRPADEADLKPIEHKPPENECYVIGEAHEDGRSTWQFQHKQPDDSIYRHEDEFVCGEDLETLIESRIIDGKCPLNPIKCKALLYPEEIKGIVSNEFYQKYRALFNKANQVGGVMNGPSGAFFVPVDLDEALCAPPQRYIRRGGAQYYSTRKQRKGAKKMLKKVKTQRKSQRKANDATRKTKRNH